ncbi:DUF1893 domain-containing protein [Tissierella creatinini]|nr:DUF1893 domain-containing protein [Tissierella creatinini]TJX62380.1 DUF1893 domain-containing protein [Soehngenia saccharolytica]
MKDIEIAKKLLLEEQLALVIVKNGEVLYKSKGRGIKPLYTAYTNMKSSLKGASVADKVIGKAAAILCVNAEIQGLYTNLISEKAIEVLDQTDIKFTYNLKVPFIKNRDNTGLCPVENLSLNVEGIDELLIGIDEFLKSIK